MGRVVPLRKKPSIAKLICSGCGAVASASCNCGKPYVPASTAAAKAVQAHPEKSDRAIAEELGVGTMTVSRARKSTVPNGTVKKRVGKDGKARKMPKKAKKAKVRLVPRDDVGRAKELGRRLSDFCQTIAEDVHKWLGTKPKLDNGTLQSLAGLFNAASEQLSGLADAVTERME